MIEKVIDFLITQSPLFIISLLGLVVAGLSVGLVLLTTFISYKKSQNE